jgi:hypothetical protein
MYASTSVINIISASPISTSPSLDVMTYLLPLPSNETYLILSIIFEDNLLIEDVPPSFVFHFIF